MVMSFSVRRLLVNVKESHFIKISRFERSLRRIHQRQSKLMATTLLDVDTPIIPLYESKRFIVDCMLAAGCSEANAEALGDNLVAADYRGHYSHGMNRLEMYVNDVMGGMCDGKAVPKINKETEATAWVDGQNTLGAAIGKFCMNLAIEKAKKVGVGWVVAKGSNHYGIAGMYSLQAIEAGLLGMSFTNTSPFLVPTRAKKPALGTNPLALGAPGKSGDSYVLDMATTAVAVGKIELKRRKSEPCPPGWALDENGQIATDAEVAYKAGRLLPLGGAEDTSGYKGYGLGMLVEIFCGILGGSAWGSNIRKWNDHSKMADLGQCFIAVDPSCFAPGFEDRMQALMDSIRAMEPVDPNRPVLVPGDPERMHMAAVDAAGGVRYVPNQHQTCDGLVKRLKVAPLRGL